MEQQDTPVSAPDKRTNVRALLPALRASRVGLKLLSATAPAIASRVAERLFFTARRHPRPAWEHELLDRARRIFVAYEDGFLPVWSWGEGPAVLLVHGWEGRGTQLGGFVEPLVEAGFRVVTFDGPGHGDAQPRRASLPDMAFAIRAVVDAVGPLHALIAHSMGALATTLALSRGVSARRVVFFAPATDPREYARGFARVLGLPERVRRGMVERIESRFDLRFDELYAPALAEKLEVPLRVIHDEADKEVPLASGQALADAWPRASLTVTHGLGHRRILREPDVIAEAVAFVRGRETAPGSRRGATRRANEMDAFGFQTR